MKFNLHFLSMTLLCLSAGGWLASCKKTSSEKMPAASDKFLLVSKTDSMGVFPYITGVYDSAREKTFFLYNDDSRLIGSIDSVQHSYSDGRSGFTAEKRTLAYDENGFLISLTDELYDKNVAGYEISSQHNYEYHYASGRITKLVSDGAESTFTYDDAGRLIKYTSAGDTLTYQYGASGMTALTEEDETYNVKTDAKGHILQLKGADAEEDMSYDAGGNMTDMVYKDQFGTMLVHHKLTFDGYKYALWFADSWNSNKGLPPVEYIHPSDLFFGLRPRTNLVSEELDVPAYPDQGFMTAFKNTYDKDGNLIMQEQTGKSSKTRPVAKIVYTYRSR